MTNRDRVYPEVFMAKSENQLRILFTSVGRRVELVQAFKRVAKENGIDLVVYGADLSKTAPALYFCDRQIQTVKIRNYSYIPNLLDICREEKINALIPTIDTDLLVLADHKENFAAVGTKVFVSDPSIIRMCRDKRKSAEFISICGLKTPATVDDIVNYKGGFPAFIKPLDGSASINAHQINSQVELEYFSRHIEKYIIQPYIRGYEYTVDVFCDCEGNPIFITPRERLETRSGEVLVTRICQDEGIIKEIKVLIKKIKPYGPLAVQLIKDEIRGDNYFIEINPRFGGGAPLSMMAGADAALALLRILRGERLDFVPYAARDGEVYSRFDQCVMVENL